MKEYWYKGAYHRNVIDMHITDHRREYLSEYDAEKYVEMLELTKAESAVVYAHSHVGLCNFPTKVGKMHTNLNGRDIFKETVEKCHEKGIFVVAYMSLIYDTWAYDMHPSWRIYNADVISCTKHRTTDPYGRYGVCCVNSPGYREYTASLAREICTGYDIEGIRFDMTFWPGICYCRHCRKRFSEEVGGEIPRVINWYDNRWVAFQRCRERWLTEFAKHITDTVRSIDTCISVEHQSSTFIHPWTFGTQVEHSCQSDFLQGDFYGGYVQGSTACKLFYNLTQNLPFGFETCSNEYLHDHTTMKNANMLEAKAYMAIANGGAFIFIDAIDPVGTLNPHVYKTMNRVFEKTANYEGLSKGGLCEDVAIYLSTESKFDFEDNGKDVLDKLTGKHPHTDGVLKVAKSLIKNHIPFGVITRKNINNLNRYKAIILSDVLMMSQLEIDAFRQYVKSGGKILATGRTSLTDTEGNKKSNFMLSDVFGADYLEETEESITYIAPIGVGKKVFPEHYNEKYPIFYSNSQIIVKKTQDSSAQILAMLVLPYSVPQIPRPFSSIHSNPPGIVTDYPCIIVNKYGKGTSIYSSAAFENTEYHDELFADLVKFLMENKLTIETSAPRQVEITTFKNADGYTINMLSFQAEMPNLPIPGFSIKIDTGGAKVRNVYRMPDKKPVVYSSLEDGRAEFEVEDFNTFSMYFVEI